MAELHLHLELLNFPAFVALNETKLDKSTADSEVKLENYTLVARRDRPEENKPKRRKKRLATGCGGEGVASYDLSLLYVEEGEAYNIFVAVGVGDDLPPHIHPFL